MCVAATDNLAPLLLTAKEAAAMLALSVDGVRYVHRVHKLPGIIVNRKLRFSRRAVEAFVREQEQEQC